MTEIFNLRLKDTVFAHVEVELPMPKTLLQFATSFTFTSSTCFKVGELKYRYSCVLMGLLPLCFKNSISEPSDPKKAYGIERLKKLGATMFKGSTDPTDVENWLNMLEKYFDVMNCPEERKVKLATFLLQKEAEGWWKSILTSNSIFTAIPNAPNAVTRRTPARRTPNRRTLVEGLSNDCRTPLLPNFAIATIRTSNAAPLLAERLSPAPLLAQYRTTIRYATHYHVPITYTSWKSVPPELKDKIFTTVEAAFVIDPRSRKNILQTASISFRQFKNWITTKYIMPHKDDLQLLQAPPEKYSFIEQNHWEEFVRSRLSETFQKEGSNEVYVDRAKMWKKARVNKQGQYDNDGIQQVVHKIDEISMNTDSSSVNRHCSNDVLTQALGTK
uniref:Serine/threonine-protein kinase nek2 n=1 Tax=Cucumis melo TaxID=3656 RepID=A0A9I9EGA9_CUCME